MPQFNLGQAYRLGRGVPINLAAAKTWFERAANSGHLDAADDARPAAVPERRAGARASNGSSRPPTRANRGRCWSMAPRSTTATASPRTACSAMPMSAAPPRRALRRPRIRLPSSTRLMPARRPPEGRRAGRAPRPKAAPAARAPRSASKPAKPPHRRRSRSPAETAPLAAIAGKPAPSLRQAASWRIQLGAFSQRRFGRSAVSASFPARPHLAGRPPYYIASRRDHPPPGRAVFKQSAAAAAACSAVGAACFPVPAK